MFGHVIILLLIHLCGFGILAELYFNMGMENLYWNYPPLPPAATLHTPDEIRDSATFPYVNGSLVERPAEVTTADISFGY